MDSYGVRVRYMGDGLAGMEIAYVTKVTNSALTSVYLLTI